MLFRSKDYRAVHILFTGCSFAFIWNPDTKKLTYSRTNSSSFDDIDTDKTAYKIYVFNAYRAKPAAHEFINELLGYEPVITAGKASIFDIDSHEAVFEALRSYDEIVIGGIVTYNGTTLYNMNLTGGCLKYTDNTFCFNANAQITINQIGRAHV